MESAEGLKIKAHDAMMTRSGPWTFSVAAVVLVGLIVGTCVTGLAEASSATDRVCAAVKGEELSLFKTPSPSLWAVPVDHTFLPLGLLQSGRSHLDPVQDLVSAHLWGDCSSRAPPALL